MTRTRRPLMTTNPVGVFCAEATSAAAAPTEMAFAKSIFFFGSFERSFGRAGFAFILGFAMTGGGAPFERFGGGGGSPTMLLGITYTNLGGGNFVNCGAVGGGCFLPTTIGIGFTTAFAFAFGLDFRTDFLEALFFGSIFFFCFFSFEEDFFFEGIQVPSVVGGNRFCEISEFPLLIDFNLNKPGVQLEQT